MISASFCVVVSGLMVVGATVDDYGMGQVEVPVRTELIPMAWKPTQLSCSVVQFSSLDHQLSCVNLSEFNYSYILRRVMSGRFMMMYLDSQYLLTLITTGAQFADEFRPTTSVEVLSSEVFGCVQPVRSTGRVSF